MASRIIVRIELTSPAKKALESMTEKQGMTQVAMLSRLVEWFSRQSKTIQASVLGQYASEDQPDTGKLIIKELAAGKK